MYRKSGACFAREEAATMPRILILSASVGAGHIRAAEAVEAALLKLEPSATVKNIDVLTLTGRTFRRLYSQTYFDIVEKAPHLLGYVYDLLDRPRSPRSKSDRLRLLVERLNMKPFFELLESERWNAVVNTHFLPAEIIASLRQKGRLATPQMTVTTDFETHRLWVVKPCEHFTTATEEGALYLQHWGAPPECTSVTGIPIHPVFSEPRDRKAILRSQGLTGDRPIVLQLAGGFGVGPIETIYQEILSIEKPLEIVAVSGRNEDAKKKLEEATVPPRHRAHVLGFTTKMHELLAVGDIVVSKPGGLTTSEALASGTAMAIVNPIPGQESRNSDFLLENGAAIKIGNLATLPYKLARLLDDPARLAALKKNALGAAKPRAAFDVARIALKLCAS
jgi:processive 1,2-diacylglycerol beta-glucosyltransferase